LEPDIIVKNLEHDFNLGKVVIPALRGVDFNVYPGEFVALVGKSGSGKSTLLNIMAGLMKASRGDVWVKGEYLNEMDENELCIFRQKHIGFVFQAFNLLNNLTASENVQMPLIFTGMAKEKRAETAENMLETVDLADRISHKPNELSGGQQQRVSVARALVNSPAIILADEPTGNLDSKTGVDIMQLLLRVNKATGATIVMVTHERDFAKYAERIIYLKDGRIIRDEKNAG